MSSVVPDNRLDWDVPRFSIVSGCLDDSVENATLFLDCGGASDGSLSTPSRSEGLPTRLRQKSSDNWINAMSLAWEFAIGTMNLLAVGDAITAFELGTLLLGGGGSAIPCGLVLPAASAKLDDAESEPDVTPTAALY